MQAIERTFGILRALADHPERARLTEIARRADLPKSTTSRILASLESLGVVERIGDRFAIGPALATLTHSASPISALRDLTRPHLVALADTLGENASLVIDDGDQVLYIDTATPSDDDIQVQVQDWTGERLPFHATAAGMTLMSSWSEDRLVDYFASERAPLTSQTVTTLAGVRAKLETLRDSGVIWTSQEFSDDVNGVAAPIHNAEGLAIGAINVDGPTYRFPGDREEHAIVTLMTDAARRIGGRFGPDT